MKQTSALVGSLSNGEAHDNIIKEGEIIVVYGGLKFIKRITLKSGEMLACRYGEFPHTHFIGKKYGERVFNRKDTKWVCPLRPTPELWTLSLNHRTQVLYSTDANMVCFMLDLGPGKVVLEAGTGSGSLSATLARAVFPDGKLITHEFHEVRAAKAKAEFTEAGLDQVITSVHQDVISNGFICEDNEADAIFLDLPSPWTCISDGYVLRALKPNGRFCSFSPCIEQVQRTCDALRATNTFTDIINMECLLRPYQVVGKREKKTIPIDRGGRLPQTDNEKKGKKRKTSDSDDENMTPETDDVTTVPVTEIRGHTGYLTFAQRLVL